jgi:hypothetical protein
LELVLNTGYAVSCVNPRVRTTLGALDHLRPIDGRYYMLHDLRIGGRLVPPLEVRVNVGIERFGFEGILGLNFLNRFRPVCFDVDTLRLRLTTR